MGYTFVGDIEEIRSKEAPYTVVAYVLCPHCHELLYTYWHGFPCTKIPERIKKLFEKCSCGNKMRYSHDFATKNYEITDQPSTRAIKVTEATLSSVYKKLYSRREGAEKKSVDNETDNFLTLCMAKLEKQDMPKDNEYAQAIAKNPDLIVQYLKFVLGTEIKIQCALEYRKHLKMQKWRSNIEANRTAGKIQADADKALATLEATYAENVQKIKNIYARELEATLAAFDLVLPEKHSEVTLNDADIPPKPRKSSYVKGKAPIAPEKPEYKQPGFFNRRKVEQDNRILEEEYRQKFSEYEEEMKQYSLAVQNYEKAIADRNAFIERKKQEIDATNRQFEEEYQRELKAYQEQKAKYEDFCIQKTAEELDLRLEACQKDFLAQRDNQINNSELSPKNVSAIAADQLLEDELQAVDKHLEMLIEGKNTLLAYNIIYPKYRRISILYLSNCNRPSAQVFR